MDREIDPSSIRSSGVTSRFLREAEINCYSVAWSFAAGLFISGYFFNQPPFAFASDARKSLFRELVAVYLTKDTAILVRRLADQITDIIVCWRVLYWA
jgi:hypothetical protein